MGWLIGVAQHVVVDKGGNLSVHVVGQDPMEVLAVKIAVAALVVAVVTLAAVGYQIYLARQELDAVKSDLANNERMINDALRKPLLEVQFVNGKSTLSMPFDGSRTNRFVDLSKLQLINKGARTSHKILVQLWIPLWAIDPKAVGNPHLRYAGGEVASNKAAFKRHQHGVDRVWPQSDPNLFDQLPVFHRVLVSEDVPIYWRAVDDYGEYPSDGAFGILTYTI